MDPVRNPFAPGAGTQPPELAGREGVIDAAQIALARKLQGRSVQSLMLLGLRGTGKTVLLNRIDLMARDHGYQTLFVEAQEKGKFPERIVPLLLNILRQLSLKAKTQSVVVSALRVLKSFSLKWSILTGEVGIEYDPQPGEGDSGNLELDLLSLMLHVGEAAKKNETGISILVDEVQYLSESELSALIVSFHRISQRELPVLFFGAGLPSLAALAGNAKSYAERLFAYPTIGPLTKAAAEIAIRHPIENEGEAIHPRAIAEIVMQTRGYPYFLQEWGFQAWNAADRSPISLPDVRRATDHALRRLDEGFFRVRLDRLSPKEKEYVLAMAQIGDGPYKSGEVAQRLDERVQALGPRRASIIRKGMIYSPAHGDIDFTVPMFADFLRRTAIR